MDDINRARLETVLELNNEFIKCIKDVLNRHGNDPELSSILAAAFTTSICQVDAVCEGFKKYMIFMLEKDYE
jgi:hypothetical protein